MGEVMTTLNNIRTMFGVQAGEPSPWTIEQVVGEVDLFHRQNVVSIRFGSNEEIGLLRQNTDGTWVAAHTLSELEDVTVVTNPLNALTNHIGGGLQNFLSNKARGAFRQVTLNYFTNSMLAKAQNLK